MTMITVTVMIMPLYDVDNNDNDNDTIQQYNILVFSQGSPISFLN